MAIFLFVFTVLGILYSSRTLLLAKNFAPGIRIRRTAYPPRLNMSECPAFFGKVTIFIATGSLQDMKGKYAVAQRSLNCYLKTVKYKLIVVDLSTDPRVKRSCSMHKSVGFPSVAVSVPPV
ncbi:hypothetical protein RB195_020792 [Necator americanus]